MTIYDKPEKHFNDGYYEVTITVPSKNALKKCQVICGAAAHY
ncbi:hypothetical protein SDC49_02350 [Lactobacillus sp. R2/2]|nr:hypothetical protein [Lactobacillus sp. R2/2]